jgi:hypothetical protein
LRDGVVLALTARVDIHADEKRLATAKSSEVGVATPQPAIIALKFDW